MTATVTSKGQVTIPAETRRRLGIRAGTKLEFILRDGDRLEVVKVGGSVRDLKGALPKQRRTLSLAEMDDAIVAGATRVRHRSGSTRTSWFGTSSASASPGWTSSWAR